MVIKVIKMVHMGDNTRIYRDYFTDRKRQLH